MAASRDIWSCLEHMCPQSAPLTERRSSTTLAEQPIIPWSWRALLGVASTVSLLILLGFKSTARSDVRVEFSPVSPWSSQRRRARFRSRRGSGPPSSSSHPSPRCSPTAPVALAGLSALLCPSPTSSSLSPSPLSFPTNTYDDCSCPWFSPALLQQQIKACAGCQLTKTSCRMHAPCTHLHHLADF